MNQVFQFSFNAGWKIACTNVAQANKNIKPFLTHEASFFFSDKLSFKVFFLWWILKGNGPWNVVIGYEEAKNSP